ncbi:MAG: hypothetical protein ORN54_09350 [Cyclobacteriaceae bacterium]|nr:hypothetical protein [Cyclobacteriaceae bacterium]
MNPEKTERKSTVVFKKGHELNFYNSDQIKAAGGIEAFNKLIGNDKPIEVPKIEFTDTEGEEIEKILKQD